MALVGHSRSSSGTVLTRSELRQICAQQKGADWSVALVLLELPNRDTHLANMAIDYKRLNNDCAAARVALVGSVGRGTGATAIIEPILPLILELLAAQHSWAAIATALAKQGVVQGYNRTPITGRRLTALINAINKRHRRTADHLAARGSRRDLAPAPVRAHGFALSADLNVTGGGAKVVTTTEESIRRQDFEDRVRSLMREDLA